MKTGIDLISEERERQIKQEGWIGRHDDKHECAELADAGLAYTIIASAQIWKGKEYADTLIKGIRDDNSYIPWPFELTWFKPSDDPIRNLEKAGALIAAEIDRLLRVDALRGSRK